MKFFSPPHFPDDPNKTRHARLLNIVSILLFVITTVLLGVNTIVDIRFGQTLNGMFVALAIMQVVIQFIFRRGYVNEAAVLLFIFSWGAITWLASSLDGVRSVLIFAYFTIFLGIGYVFGWRLVALFTAASIAVIWFFAYQEWSGLRPVVTDEPVGIAINLTGMFIFASAQIYFVINVLKKSLYDVDQELRERQKIEQVLRGEQERLALALDASKMETWSWNIETGSVSWSDGIERLFGMGDGQFDGRYETYLSLIHPDDLPKLQEAIERALVDPDFSYIIDHRLMRSDGEIRWLEGRGNVYRNQAGIPIRMAGTVVDVTNRKVEEAEREELFKELGAKNFELEQFIYMVSHDLKAPIITIKGFLGYLEQDALNGNHARLQGDLTRIGGAVDKMHRLLNELLELSRIGRMVNTSELLPFGDLVKEALEILHGRLQTVSPQIRVADQLPVVYGDRRRLVEVLQNLVDNAVKFLGDQPQPLIEIGTRGKENEMPILFVRDNGVGIAPQHYERIFGLFNRLDPNVEGTGVGLALVKRIIEFHGGRIWVESDQGRGSTFFFTLPPAA